MEAIRKIIENVLMALYQPFGFAIIMTILIMFLYIFLQEKGWKELLEQWITMFKNSSAFRRMAFLVFYTCMILFRTLLNRGWMNPILNVFGVWGIYDEDGTLTTECIENLALFCPFIILLFISCRDKILGLDVRFDITIWQSIKIVFLFSLTIEFLQLFLRLGTFQLSDLFYNTLGGLIGGLIYWIGYKIKHQKKK